MQIIITMDSGSMPIPINYNYQLQSAIYNAISDNEEYSSFLHDEGYVANSSEFKLFTFGKIRGKYRVAEKQLHFIGDTQLEIRSISDEFCNILKTSFLKNKRLKIANSIFNIQMIEVYDKFFDTFNADIKTDSPIVVKLSNEDGKSYYVSPSDDIDLFNEMINRNYINKYLSAFGEYPELPIRLLPISAVKKFVTQYKGIWITGYDGKFSLEGDQGAINFLYNVGLGGSNSQGFGMFGII